MKSSRLVRGLTAAGVAACVSLGATAPADASSRGGIPDSKISVQLWTFAEYIEFGNNIPRTEEVFRRLRDMGYRNVEPFSLGGLTAKEYRALLKKYKLKASARHVDVGTPQNPADIDQILADNKTLGIKYFGSGSTPIFPPIYTTEAEWVAYAKYLDEVGAKARRAGQRLMVHNHDVEFSTKFGDKTVFDILMANTDPRNVVFQLDLYWVTAGGGDPIAVLERYGKRIQLFHVKDMRESDRRIEIVGRGIIDFQRIFAAGKGIRYYVVEHDPRFGDPTFDPFEAAEVGFNYLKDPSTAKPRDTSFQKVVIDATPGEPMDLAVLPDGKALHVERSGEVWMHNPANGLKTLAATVDVYEHDEEGLQSIALDPNFRSNRWIYLYYSPPLDTPTDDPDTPTVNEGDAPFEGTPDQFEPFKGYIQLSRFKWTGSTVDLASEQKIIQVPVDRGICCHVGGDILFDRDGNLILATGDDTNPFESDGYAPIDERSTRNPAFDAQRTAANTNDLRGKVLRIRVGANGGYSIPRGNLFVDANQQTRPEIYAMGLRNPFRIEYNARTDELYVADYSPDASAPNPARGPAGHGKWTIVTEPGNYGWPYCATAQLPYTDYDFATGTSGAPFNCAAPVNESPHNTGVRELPPVTQPDVWYSYGASAEFPELGTGGIGPMAGPAYVYDRKVAKKKDSVAWPPYYDNVPLFYEWTRDYIKAFFTRDSDLTRIEPVLATFDFDNPIDLEFGPNGALYVLEYGDGFFGKNLPGAEFARVDHVGATGNRSPTVTAAASTAEGPGPLAVQFTGTASDPDGDRLSYAWDFEADGKVDSRAQNPAHTYTVDGVYRATLRVTDRHGRSVSDYVEITVGVRPTVELTVTDPAPPFAFGDTVNYTVTVTDDGEVDCSRVRVTYVLGHDQHGHPQTTAAGCTGSITTSLAGGHDPSQNLRAVFVAEYTDEGSGNLPPLTGSDEVVIQPGT